MGRTGGCEREDTILINFDWSDATLIRYAFGWVVALYGSILFGWWWKRSGKASFVYACITFWFIGCLVERSIQVYGRALRLITGTTVFSENNFIWIAKGDIATLAQIVIVTYLTLRIFGYVDLAMRKRVENDKKNRCVAGKAGYHTTIPVISYRCTDCGREFHVGEVGYETAKAKAEK